ncbi:MAG: DegT/DnrJ/EryC1/StrS family aminotransferase, partial [Nitrososphaeria archaeon]
MIPLSEPTIGEEEKANVMEVMESTMLTNKEGRGRFCRLFEEKVSKFTNAKHVYAMTSGTAALHASLMALGVEHGDEVILPSLTFVATAEVVLHVGAKPVFADINPETYTIDPQDMKKLFTEKTKAVIPVDLYGLPADLDEIMEIAHGHGVRVVEEAAQSVGAEYKGRSIGCISDLTCISLYPSKN